MFGRSKDIISFMLILIYKINNYFHNLKKKNLIFSCCLNEWSPQLYVYRFSLKECCMQLVFFYKYQAITYLSKVTMVGLKRNFDVTKKCMKSITLLLYRSRVNVGAWSKKFIFYWKSLTGKRKTGNNVTIEF